MNSTLEASQQNCTAAAFQPFPANAEGIPFEHQHLQSYDETPSAHVEIYDQVYHLRGVDPDYIMHLANVVDRKMRAVSEQGNTVDSLRVAVLAALNFADELTSLRQSYDQLAGAQQSSQSSLRSRADSLAGMLDEVLLVG